jgi:hypothetical protein
MMDTDIELISDGDGIAVIGDPHAVDQFLATTGLPSRDLGLDRLSAVTGATSVAAHAGSAIAAGSGRWVQLTTESAQVMKHASLMKGPTAGVSRAIAMGGNKTSHILQIVGKGSILSNPAVLAGAAGIMTQIAMQQAMDEITDYLATIDAKVDDILRNQQDAVVADMLGVHVVVDDAMTVRAQMGRVPEITWSKVQNAESTLARTQMYALRQLDAIAEKLERTSKLGDLASESKGAERQVQEWLAMLARCYQLQSAVAVLELDRVLDASPDELDQHRIALRITRQNRLDLISVSTERLLTRMEAATRAANAKVLLQPLPARAVVHSSNRVRAAIVDFNARLGIERDREAWEARRWLDAATDVRDRVLETGADGVGAARQLGSGTWERTRSATGRIAGGIAERAVRLRGDGTAHDEEN